MTRLGAVIVCVSMVCSLPACAASLTIGSSEVGGPQCSSPRATQPERLDGALVLIAQSVPTASQVPCLRQLPAGWTFNKMDAARGKTRIALDLGRDNSNAVTITFTRECDVGDATRVRSDQPKAVRYERTQHTTSEYRAQRYYVFPGGCVTDAFDLHGARSREAADTISHALAFVSRSSLRRYVSEYSDGRLQLDPGRPG